jgi:hypothetical protein
MERDRDSDRERKGLFGLIVLELSVHDWLALLLLGLW